MITNLCVLTLSYQMQLGQQKGATGQLNPKFSKTRLVLSTTASYNRFMTRPQSNIWLSLKVTSDFHSKATGTTCNRVTRKISASANELLCYRDLHTGLVVLHLNNDSRPGCCEVAHYIFQYVIKKYILKIPSNLKANWYRFATGCQQITFPFCRAPQP